MHAVSTPRQRAKNGIQFPYRDLESSVTVAKTIADAGAQSMWPKELAAALENAEAGNFYNRVASARMFGFVTNKRGTAYQLTELAYAILSTDGRKQRDARVRAFLNVPLYQQIYETYKGGSLPLRPHGLQDAFILAGVPSKVADRARQAFERSARFAGFFEAGEDRLTLPPLDWKAPPMGSLDLRAAPRATPRPSVIEEVAMPPAKATISPEEPAKVLAADSDFVRGLMKALPPVGEKWPRARRVEWLKIAISTFNLLYDDDGDILITVPAMGRPRLVTNDDV